MEIGQKESVACAVKLAEKRKNKYREESQKIWRGQKEGERLKAWRWKRENDEWENRELMVGRANIHILSQRTY